ncbi:MAG: outer membrane protein assembly factor BamE [Pseudomonadales bacterium]
MRIVTTLLICSALLLQGACSLTSLHLPRVHKVTVQQGNLITQDMVDRLKPGMTRSQVAYVMGEPVVRNSFDDARWDYIYTIEIPGYYQEEKRLSLFFENGLLAYFTGDFVPSAAAPDSGTAGASTAAGPAAEAPAGSGAPGR